MLRIVGRNIFAIDKKIVGTYKGKKYYAEALRELDVIWEKLSDDDDEQEYGLFFHEDSGLRFGRAFRLWEIGLYELKGTTRQRPAYSVEVLVRYDGVKSANVGIISSRQRMWELSYKKLKSKHGYRLEKLLVMDGSRSIPREKALRIRQEKMVSRRLKRKADF